VFVLDPDPDFAVDTEGLRIVRELFPVRFLFLLLLSALFSIASATSLGSCIGGTIGGGGGACIFGRDKHMFFSLLIIVC